MNYELFKLNKVLKDLSKVSQIQKSFSLNMMEVLIACIQRLISIQRPILNGFGNVMAFDDVGFVEIGDCPAKFDDSVVCTGRETKGGDGFFEQGFACFVNGTVLADEPRSHVGIGENTRVICKTFALNLSSFFNFGTHIGRRLGCFRGVKVFVFHSRYFDMDVDSIEKRTRNLGHISFYGIA